MRITKTFLGLTLSSILICTAPSIAKTIEIKFRHIEATTGHKGGKTPLLCISLYKFGHRAGMNCERPYSNHHSGIEIPGINVGRVIEDDITSGLGFLFGDYDLIMSCRDSYNDYVPSHMINTHFNIKNDGTNEIDISASCPVGEHNETLRPADIQIERKK
jgi:hypothetical protein